MIKYSYVKAVNADRLTQEIQLSSIISALEHVATTGTQLDIFFKAALSPSDQVTLDAIVISHVNTPLVVVSPPQDVVITKDKPFKDAGGFRLRIKGMAGVAAKGVVSTIDYLVPEERFINGVTLLLKYHEWGDHVKFQVVDKDNILGFGAGVVLDTFGDSWYVNDEKQDQDDVSADYPARILAGLYIRLVYTSVGTVNDVEVKMNMWLHKKTT